MHRHKTALVTGSTSGIGLAIAVAEAGITANAVGGHPRPRAEEADDGCGRLQEFVLMREPVRLRHLAARSTVG